MQKTKSLEGDTGLFYGGIGGIWWKKVCVPTNRSWFCLLERTIRTFQKISRVERVSSTVSATHLTRWPAVLFGCQGKVQCTGCSSVWRAITAPFAWAEQTESRTVPLPPRSIALCLCDFLFLMTSSPLSDLSVISSQWSFSACLHGYCEHKWANCAQVSTWLKKLRFKTRNQAKTFSVHSYDCKCDLLLSKNFLYCSGIIHRQGSFLSVVCFADGLSTLCSFPRSYRVLVVRIFKISQEILLQSIIHPLENMSKCRNGRPMTFVIK